MAVGIIDLDLITQKNSYLVNLDVMQISAYYKSIGERVRLVRSLSPEDLGWYSILYVIYNGYKEIYIDDLLKDPRVIIIGKYFYGDAKVLPQEIIDCYPDKSIYDYVINTGYFSISRNNALRRTLNKSDFIRLHEPSNLKFLTSNLEVGFYDTDISEKDFPIIKEINKKFFLYHPIKLRSYAKAREWLDNNAYIRDKRLHKNFIANNFTETDLNKILKLPATERRMFAALFGDCSKDCYNLDLKKMIRFVECNKVNNLNISVFLAPIEDKEYRKLYKIVYSIYNNVTLKSKERTYFSYLNLKDRSNYELLIKLKAVDPELYRLLSTPIDTREGDYLLGK